MHPILFHVGSITIYSYGFCIAIGSLLGFIYMSRQGKQLFGTSFDKSNTLFILLVVMGFLGGKVFMIFENPSRYLSHPGDLVSGGGFVFYGSLLFTIPTMLWFFKKNNIPTLAMLDVMAAVTCIVHGFGRIGCFMAGCCYGLPTDSWFAVIFTDTTCQADPLNTPLVPTQLIEAAAIFCILMLLLFLRNRKQFDGQLFLLYLMTYASVRGIIELFRGDLDRGFILNHALSNSQFISLLIIAGAAYFYVKLRRKAKLNHASRPTHGK